MMRIFPRRRAQHEIGAGTDKVLFGISLPSDCRLNGLTAEVHVMGQLVRQVSQAMMYGIEGYVLPILDPDSAPDFDTVWDTLVPKDDDTDTIDLDTGATDTVSMFEPGESSMAEVMDLGMQPQRIYNMQRLKTFANSAFKQEDASALEWVMTDVIKIRIRKRYRVRAPSVILFALGNPDLLDTSSAALAALAENEWPRIKYAQVMLEQALMQHFGLTEAGATTPWTNAATLLRKYLEPDVFEQSVGAWAGETVRTFSNVTFDVSVPGTMEKIQIGTGG